MQKPETRVDVEEEAELGRELLLLAAVEHAQQCVYELDQVTPLDSVLLPGGRRVYLKREDRSRIFSYKWRGAYNKIRYFVETGNQGPFVAASAGNHAQGVAASANALKVTAEIFMPCTTPKLKQESVKRLGGDLVHIHLVGDSFDEAAQAARQFLQEKKATMIAPFDDLHVIGGQATVGCELLDQLPNCTKIYVPIGGGGLASGVAFACKKNKPEIQVIGVEVTGQDSMRQSIEAGKLVSLQNVDLFCDGTAVRRPGQKTFALCEQYLDRIDVVTNQQVSAAAQFAWEVGRFVPEPSGAIGLAAMLMHEEQDQEEIVASIVTGANTDFLTLPRIVRLSSAADSKQRYFQFEIGEHSGSLIELLDQFLDEMNIVDFRYGLTSRDRAFPVLGIRGPAEQLETFWKNIQRVRQDACELTGQVTVNFRMIPFNMELTVDPVFFRIDFPDRPGALRGMMREVSGVANICYFNFVETGEALGHALVGFELAAGVSKDQFCQQLQKAKVSFKELAFSFLRGIVSSTHQ